MSETFHYRPFQATSTALLLYLALAALLGGLEIAAGGALWPILQMPSWWHVLFWMLVFMSPVLVLQMGWSYVLTSDELVVLRFGKERSRHRFDAYTGRSMWLGYPRLEFGRVHVRIASGADGPRQQFLAELDARAMKHSDAVVRGLGAKVEGNRVTLRVAKLRFPEGCASCGDRATRAVTIRAERGWDLVLGAHIQFVAISVPVCEHHAKTHRTTQWGAYAIVFVLGAVFGTAILSLGGVISGAPALEGALLVGGIVGLIAMRIAQAARISRLVSYVSLGVAAVKLDAELSRVTLKVRDPVLRDELAADGSLEEMAGVFS